MDKTKMMCDPMDVLESLTPGGSEFHNDPQMCKQFIRDRLATVTKVARERNELREENNILRAALAEIIAAVVEGDPQAIADAIEHTHSV